MSKIEITQTLAEIIKSEREKRNISARKLSEQLGKSITYISLIERKKVQKIDYESLDKIFHAILHDLDEKSYSEYMKNLSVTVGLDLDNKDLENEEWLYYFSYIKREIPITDDIIEFIKTSLEELSITSDELISTINKNIGLKNKDIEDNKLVINDTSISYKFNLSENVVEEIIQKKKISSNYVLMLGIINNIYILKNYDSQEAIDKAYDFLFSHKFYTLNQIVKSRKQHTQDKNPKNNNYSNETEYELPIYEESFKKSLDSLVSYFNFQRDFNILNAIKITDTLNYNLKYDAGFMNVIFKIPFFKYFKDFDKEQKQEFLNSLIELIKDTIEKNKTSQINDDEYTHPD